MKAVLMSIQPKWCELIASGKKTVEVRKTKPKLEMPFKVYIYETNWSNNTYWKHHHEGQLGKVIGEFVCDRIDSIGKRGCDNNFDYCYLSLNVFGNDDIEVEITDIQRSCIPKHELNAYGENSPCLYAWHITDLVIYDKPRELREFKPYNRSEDDCKFSHLGFAIPKCQECRECYVKRPPQSWCYVEEVTE